VQWKGEKKNVGKKKKTQQKNSMKRGGGGGIWSTKTGKPKGNAKSKTRQKRDIYAEPNHSGCEGRRSRQK